MSHKKVFKATEPHDVGGETSANQGFIMPGSKPGSAETFAVAKEEAMKRERDSAASSSSGANTNWFLYILVAGAAIMAFALYYFLF